MNWGSYGLWGWRNWGELGVLMGFGGGGIGVPSGLCWGDWGELGIPLGFMGGTGVNWGSHWVLWGGLA